MFKPVYMHDTPILTGALHPYCYIYTNLGAEPFFEIFKY